jgi:hypothetical protein
MHDLAGLVDSCHRQGTITEKRLYEIISFVKTLILAQVSNLEKELLLSNEPLQYINTTSTSAVISASGHLNKSANQSKTLLESNKQEQQQLLSNKPKNTNYQDHKNVIIKPPKSKILSPLLSTATTSNEAKESILNKVYPNDTFLKSLIRKAWLGITAFDRDFLFANPVR